MRCERTLRIFVCALLSASSTSCASVLSPALPSRYRDSSLLTKICRNKIDDIRYIKKLEGTIIRSGIGGFQIFYPKAPPIPVSDYRLGWLFVSDGPVLSIFSHMNDDVITQKDGAVMATSVHGRMSGWIAYGSFDCGSGHTFRQIFIVDRLLVVLSVLENARTFTHQ